MAIQEKGKEIIVLDSTFASNVGSGELEDAARQGRQVLESGDGPGREFTGWLDLPTRVTDDDLGQLARASDEIRKCDLLVTVGIGGSYLGAKAVIEALSEPFAPGFEVLFAGHQLDADYHQGLLGYLEGKDFAVNVISKSGTTTEPGVAFRLLLDELVRRHDRDGLRRRVFVTTDEKKGKLRPLVDDLGLSSFVVPDDVGGRYSVLTPVGLLPIAAAGFDIEALLGGAKEMAASLRDPAADSLQRNPAMAYAAYRNAAYRSGRKIEVLASYTPRLSFISEWWKQLFGESEGKGKKGIFPASVNLTSDLHSMGQWLQDGERTVFETILDVERARGLTIPKAPLMDDGLGHLDSRDLHEVNRTVLQAAAQAHFDGDVPCLQIRTQEIQESTIGALLYFFEYSCGVSAYMLGVNPFDQPGVEAYKKNMKRLLG